MSLLFQLILISHIVFGLIGVIGFYAILMALLKKTPPHTFLKFTSLITFLAIIASWISGGYYYVFYYGANVKPIIKEGAYPWAHLVITETKEHVFLVLPFIAFVLMLFFWIGNTAFFEKPHIKRGIIWLAAVGTILGVFITLAGVIITGGAQ